jgi:predicted transcriptional regulator
MTHAPCTTQANFREEAKIALLRRRMSISDLAAKIGRPRSSVSRAINGEVYPRLREAIRKALKL